MLNRTLLNREKKAKKQIEEFTIYTNLLCQFVVLPLFCMMFFTPILFMYFIVLLWGGGSATVTSLNIYTVCMLVGAVVSPFIFRYSMGGKLFLIKRETALLNFILSFTALIVNFVFISLVYLIGTDTQALLTAQIINPMFLMLNLIDIFGYWPIWSMPLLYFVYSGIFFIITHKYFFTAIKEQRKNKKLLVETEKDARIKISNKNLMQILTVLVTVICVGAMVFSGSVAYPEIEYLRLKESTKQLTVLEDYDFLKEEEDLHFANDRIPFFEWNRLASLNETATLTFDDIELTPRMDGEKRLYAMYAAIADNTYTGIKSYVNNDENKGKISSYLFVDECDGTRYGIGNKVICTKTNRAYERLISGDADIIFSFEPTAQQILDAEKAGLEFNITKIGYDAFCFFTDAKNDVNSVTSKQIVDIYSGKIKNWRKLGGVNHQIFPFTRPKAADSQKLMEKVVLNDNVPKFRYEAKVMKGMWNNSRIVGGYINTPYSMGYMYRYYTLDMVTAKSIKYLSIDGVQPTPEAIKTGEYKYSIPFYAVTVKGKESNETQALLEWMQGEQGQELVTKSGYVGIA